MVGEHWIVFLLLHIECNNRQVLIGRPSTTRQLLAEERKKLREESEALNRRELQIQLKELEGLKTDIQRSRLVIWLPTLVSCVAAVAGIIGAWLPAYYGYAGKDIDRETALQTTAANGAAQIRLEREKSKNEFVLELVKTSDLDQARRNIRFAVKAGFLRDADGKILKAVSDPDSSPGLPSNGISNADVFKNILNPRPGVTYYWSGWFDSRDSPSVKTILEKIEAVAPADTPSNSVVALKFKQNGVTHRIEAFENVEQGTYIVQLDGAVVSGARVVYAPKGTPVDPERIAFDMRYPEGRYNFRRGTTPPED